LFDPATGNPETQHDPNPVPLYLVHSAFRGKKFVNGGNLREPLGMLSDVAPTVLALMELPKPEEMTGKDLSRELR
ncbi:MAG: hypothetical protein AAB967_03920, partial [Patescibacteria group bacterium]